MSMVVAEECPAGGCDKHDSRTDVRMGWLRPARFSCGCDYAVLSVEACRVGLSLDACQSKMIQLGALDVVIKLLEQEPKNAAASVTGVTPSDFWGEKILAA